MSGSSDRAPASPGAPRSLGPLAAVALLTALLCAALAWLTPRPQSDLYLALAGGRDVAQGRLGAPDDWSFATGDRVWIHQNWLGDLTLYAAEAAGGETGLLVLKALLLAAIMAAVTAAARARRVSLPVALLAAALAVAAWPQALLLRANLFSLVFAPLLLLLLYRSVRRPALVWLAAGLIALWANTHGAFMFGIALLGLWTVVHLAAALFRPEPGDRWRRSIHSAAAVAAAAAAAGLLNPFGLENLRVPFLVRTSNVWQSLTEWQPLFSAGATRAQTPWIFMGLAGVLVLGAGARLLFGGGRKAVTRQGGSGAAGHPAAVAVFEAALAAVLIVMALRSQRFVLFAAVLLAPLAAIVLEWLLQPARRRLPLLAAAALTLAGLWAQSAWVLPHYRADNPARPPESLFGRMVHARTHFPTGAAAFLNANGLGGRVYNEWRWEGYLRWRCPQLELFAGGRAHQAYAENTARDYFSLLQDPNPAERLAALDVHLAVVPLDADLGPFCLALLQSKSSPWAYLYCDRMSAVFVDVNGPGHEDLLDRARRGGLDYGDEATAALSRALCLTSPALEAPPREAMEALNRALEIAPTRFAYAPLFSRARAAGLSQGEIIALFEDHAKRLEPMSTDGPGGADILLCRLTVASILDSLYDPQRQRAEKTRIREAAAAADRELQEIVRTYRFTTRIR